MEEKKGEGKEGAGREEEENDKFCTAPDTN